MIVVEWLSAAGCVLGGVAACAALWSPRARRLRNQRDQREQEQRETHQALFGKPEKLSDSGALIEEGTDGLLADMRTVMAKLSAPLLNGKGDDLLETVDRLDKRTSRQGRDIAAIKRAIQVERS